MAQALPPPAARAAEPLWPSEPEQVVATRFLVGKARLQLQKRSGVVLHDRDYYRLGSLESREYPLDAKLTLDLGERDGPFGPRLGTRALDDLDLFLSGPRSHDRRLTCRPGRAWR